MFVCIHVPFHETSSSSTGNATYCMSNKTQLQNAHKCKAAELSMSQNKNYSEGGSKIQKRNHPSASQFPPEFWDNLSKIDLTRRALQELDRRNVQSVLRSQSITPSSSSSSSRPPVAPHAAFRRRKDPQPIRKPTEYPSRCEKANFGGIQRFARHGGPALFDLRGVCLFDTYYEYKLTS